MDVELVISAQNGDKEAFTRLAGQMTATFLAVAHRVLRDGDLAEDATQQALIRVWQALPQLRNPDRFESWSYRLLINACYMESRRARRWVRPIRVDPSDAQSDGSDLVVDQDQLERAFRRLSIDHRTVVVLRHYQHMSLGEVAQTLGIPAGTAASRYHYAMRILRSALEADARASQPTVAS